MIGEIRDGRFWRRELAKGILEETACPWKCSLPRPFHYLGENALAAFSRSKKEEGESDVNGVGREVLREGERIGQSAQEAL